MIKLTLAVFLLLNSVHGNSQLRGRKLDGPSFPTDTIGWYTEVKKGERLNQYGAQPQCTGAVCDLWGDPHVNTCDGRDFDCQAYGLVTVMKNELYNVQAHLVEIGADEKKRLAERAEKKKNQDSADDSEEDEVNNDGEKFHFDASITNDIAISITPEDIESEQIVFQLGFGDLSHVDAAADCKKYQEYLGGPANEHRIEIDPTAEGQDKYRKNVNNIKECRQLCHKRRPRPSNGRIGCDKFSLFPSGNCTLFKDSAPLDTDPKHDRVISGERDSECGQLKEKDVIFPTDEAAEKSGLLKNTKGAECPLFFHVNEVMQNISEVATNGYLYGGQNENLSVQMIDNGQAVRILHKLKSGSTSEFLFRLAGNGPGELFSCNFKFDVCLPESNHNDVEKFKESIGLFGAPNGDPNDDFKDRDGNIFDMRERIRKNEELYPFKPERWRKEKAWVDHCYDWCVEKDDAIVVPAPGQNIDDILCREKQDPDSDPSCIMTFQELNAVCSIKHKCKVQYDQCMVDLCVGGDIDDVTPTETLSTNGDPPEIHYDPPVCSSDDNTFENTSTTTCPGSPSIPIVKVTHGPAPPQGSEIFYDINPFAGYDDRSAVTFRVNNPFDSAADVYVKYDYRLKDESEALDPTCESRGNVNPGCDSENEAPVIKVPCRDYDRSHPFATVRVYFASKDFDFGGNRQVDKCCELPDEAPDSYDDGNVVAYTFEIQCSCPSVPLAQ